MPSPADQAVLDALFDSLPLVTDSIQSLSGEYPGRDMESRIRHFPPMLQVRTSLRPNDCRR